MQQLNKVSTLEDAAFVRGTRTCQSRRLPYGKLAVNEAALFGCRSYTFVSVCPKEYFKAIGIFMGKLEVKRLKRFTR